MSIRQVPLECAVQHMVNVANAARICNSLVQPFFEPAFYVEEKYALEILGRNYTHATKVCNCSVCAPLNKIPTGHNLVTLGSNS